MIIVAPDKFKGSLSGSTVARVIAERLQAVHRNETIVELPIADGGEGSVDIALRSGYEEQHAWVTGPIGGRVHARYARRNGKAILESAMAAGLDLLPLPPNKLTAATASTYGVGEQILHAIDRGVSSIVLGVGGTSTTDGGAGLASALGAITTTSRGADLPPGARGLAELAVLDLRPMVERLALVDVVIASDVDNPLLGVDGAATVFGPQKGADAVTLEMMEANLTHWAAMIEKATGRTVAEMPGAGAGGGIAAPLLATEVARMEVGADVMMELSSFSTLVEAASLVIVGEGSLDAQSLRGKGPIRVAQRAKECGAFVLAVVGVNRLTDREVQESPIDRVYALNDVEPDIDECMADPLPILQAVADLIAHDTGGLGPR